MRLVAFFVLIRQRFVVAASAASQTTEVVTTNVNYVNRGLVGLALVLALAACGGPAQSPPAPLPQATAQPPTVAPPPTSPPEPTPTPLSLSDVGSEFRTFVNEAYQYAIQVPLDWAVTPRGAGHADRIEVSAAGPSEIRGPNIVPPLVFAISALGPATGYRSFNDVEANRAVGDETLDTVDLEVAGLPARRIHSRDEVYGDSIHYIMQRDDQFFVVDVYGYDKPLVEPILNTFSLPPELSPATVAGQIRELDAQARMMTVAEESGSGRQVIWFTDTELLPRGRLEGFIDAGDYVKVEGFAGDSEQVEATHIMLQAPEHVGGAPVLEFQRLGGIAGFQDSLVVFDDGIARLQSGNNPPVEKNLSEDQWKQVKNYIAIFKPFAWHNEDNPGGPDNLATDLDFYGAGKFEAGFDNQQEVVGYIQELLAQLSE
ncbi:MAG: hypothetical protein ACE5HA_04420 [Anaerolineae bacterium]